MNTNSEADNQIKIYNKLGFNSLKIYLSENIEYS